MVPRVRYIANLSIADRLRGLAGCIVECGVWRGGMIAGIAELLGPGRDYYLFDSFEGMPPAREIDGPAALAWQADTTSPHYLDNCRAEVDHAEAVMRRTGARSYRLVKGWFDRTLPGFRPTSPIALLRLDADWYDSTLTCLEHLFPLMHPLGVIVVDDYYLWDGCGRAVHEFLARQSAPLRIRQHPYGSVCYIQRYAEGLPPC